MVKKSRSAKQKANDKRLGRIAKLRAKKSIKIHKVKRTMVKRKRRKAKHNATSGFSLNKLAPLLAPVAYGFIRERASDALANIPALKNLPATQFTDEAVMLGALWGLKKLGVGKKGIGASLIRSGKTIELARVGQTFADMQTNKSVNNTATIAGYNSY